MPDVLHLIRRWTEASDTKGAFLRRSSVDQTLIGAGSSQTSCANIVPNNPNNSKNILQIKHTLRRRRRSQNGELVESRPPVDRL